MIGAFYQCFKNQKATEHVLLNFKKHFPESPVTLISDGGDDFSELANKYDISDYHWFPNIVNGFKWPCNAWQTECWWSRIKLTIDNNPQEYVLILEDDVLVTRPFKIEERFSLRGIWEPGNIIRKPMSDAIGYNCHYGMCGGGLINVADFLSIYDDVIEDIKTNHDRLIKHNEFFLLGAFDANIVYHFCKRGFKYEKNPWLSEVLRDKDCMSYPLVHQFKDYYK
jgi:hypothetical protein